MSLKKSQSLMRNLKEKLEFRLPSGYVFADSFDSSGNPVLSIQQDSSWATTEQKATIRIKPIDNPGVNSLGQTQESFGPHLIQMVAEESAVSGKSALSDANRDKIMREMVRLGAIVETYLSAITADPDVSEIVAGNLDSRLADLMWPEMGDV